MRHKPSWYSLRRKNKYIKLNNLMVKKADMKTKNVNYFSNCLQIGINLKVIVIYWFVGNISCILGYRSFPLQ